MKLPAFKFVLKGHFYFQKIDVLYLHALKQEIRFVVSARLNKIANNKNIQSLSGNILFAVMGFLSYVVLTRSFDKEIFGQWVLYVTAAVFIEMLRFGLTRTAMVRYLSGASPEEKKILKGSNYIASLGITIIIVVLLIFSNHMLGDTIQSSGYRLFFQWYPVLAFINLPYNNAITNLQAAQRFDKILYIKAFNIVTFVLFLAVNLFYLKGAIHIVVIAHLIINLVSSLIAIWLGWDGLRYLMRFSIASMRRILHYGKYASGTLLGSNLLQSADTVIIGLSAFMGPAAVAMYSIPLKLTELLDIPIKSFVATAFPKMSKAAIEEKPHEVREIFYTYSGALTWFFAAIAIVGFFFAKPLVTILGGADYAETAIIFQIFCLYGIFLPVEKFTGVGLDSLNRPSRNFVKVILMVLANILGDLLAVFSLVKLYPDISKLQVLIFVAVVTVIMTIIGQIAGFTFLKKEIPIHYWTMLGKGRLFFVNDLYHFLRKKD